MRFLLDESADGRLGPYPRRAGYDVATVAHDIQAGLPDWLVLRPAVREGRVLIAEDTDFGRLVFVEKQPQSGSSCSDSIPKRPSMKNANGSSTSSPSTPPTSTGSWS